MSIIGIWATYASYAYSFLYSEYIAIFCCTYTTLLSYISFLFLLIIAQSSFNSWKMPLIAFYARINDKCWSCSRFSTSTALFQLLIFFHLVSSTLALFRGRIFIRVLCFDHPSSTLATGEACDVNSFCDPEFIFCFYNSSSTNRNICNLGRSDISFQDKLRLGVCAGSEHQNLPDPLKISMTTNASDLSLNLEINDLDKSGFFSRRFKIDTLSFRLLPAGLPTLPYGQKPEPKDFVKVPIASRTYDKRGQPSVQLEAVVQCPEGLFGELCDVECTATDQFGCFNNGKSLKYKWSINVLYSIRTGQELELMISFKTYEHYFWNEGLIFANCVNTV